MECKILNYSKIAKFASGIFSNNDKNFLQRIYNDGLSKYIDRLKSIGFIEFDSILDAGCGFGQWSLALAQLNKSIISIDVSSERVDFINKLIKYYKIKNIQAMVQSIEDPSFREGMFDAIFCYSVIYNCSYTRVVKQFYRMLRPGGELYICSNSIGWYIYNIVANPNACKDFSPSNSAVGAINSSFEMLAGGSRDPNYDYIMPSSGLCRLLVKCGFEILYVGGEGTYGDSGNSFFLSEYMGLEAVYEVLARKHT
jgi:SAM-dependent methyltransferase